MTARRATWSQLDGATAGGDRGVRRASNGKRESIRAEGDGRERIELGGALELRYGVGRAAVEEQQLTEPLMRRRVIRVQRHRALVVALGLGPAPARLQQTRARRERFSESAVESDRTVDCLEGKRHQRIDANVGVQRENGVHVRDAGERSREHRVLLGCLLEVVERAAKTGFPALKK